MEIKEKDLYLAKLLEKNAIKEDEFEDIEYKPEINEFDSKYLKQSFVDKINFGWSVWQEQATPEGFVLVDKKHTEDWYLDDDEGMWWDADGIDNSLCDLEPGKVQAVEHKEYLITESNTLYAAKVWDDLSDQVGYWEFFKTKDEADKAAAYCKAKLKGEPVKAQEQSHELD